MKTLLFAIIAVVLVQLSAVAQTNAPEAAPAVYVNTAIIPVPRTDRTTNRQALVLQRAKDNPGDYEDVYKRQGITNTHRRPSLAAAGDGRAPIFQFFAHGTAISTGSLAGLSPVTLRAVAVSTTIVPDDTVASVRVNWSSDAIWSVTALPSLFNVTITRQLSARRGMFHVTINV